MYSQVSNLFLPKLPCTRFQSVIEISLVSCVCRFSLCLLFQCLKMFHRVHLHAKGGCVTHVHLKTHREFNKTNRHELFLKSSLSAKGRRSTDPITNFRAKVRMSPGMSLDAFKSTFQSIFQPPHLTQSRTLFHRPDKGKPNS